MFISQLKARLVAYDPYGIHRTNGLKALFILVLMLVFELFSSMVHPYFYYFFVPINCLNAEIIGNTIKQKYLFFIYSILGSIMSIFLFGVFSVYKTYFVFFVFFYSAALYYFFIYRLKNMLAVVPVILGVASYSLIYLRADSNFYIALNHALETIVGACVIVAGLYIFPKKYYLAIWRRAFYEVMVHLEVLCAKLSRREEVKIGIISGVVMMQRYSKMLPRKGKSYSLLKITLLAFELGMSMSYFISFEKQLRIEYLRVLHSYLEKLCQALKKREPVALTSQERPVFNTSHELRILYQLILSWNYVCEK